jgi:hypothetical protein
MSKSIRIAKDKDESMEALSGPVPGAGTPSEVRERRTRPSGTTYSIFSSSLLGLMESTFSLSIINNGSST